MLAMNLQLFHKPTLATRVPKGTSYVQGGKVATVEYHSANGSRIERAHMFSNNDGFVKDFEMLTSSKLASKKYDIYVDLSVPTAKRETPYLGSAAASGKLSKKTGRQETAIIGININTPKGVSEKQEAYAKKVAGNKLEQSARRFAQGVALGQTTLENFSQVFKQQPALSARDVLDGKFR